MDEIFKSEVILVVMEKEEGVSFEEFSGLFHQVHGYQLKLTNYGYKSLKNVLDDMKDEVEILNVNGQQLIKCRPPCPLNVIAPSTDISFQENEPFVTEPCSASSNKGWSQSGDNPLDEFPKEQPSCKPKQPGIRCHKLLHPAKQSTLQSEDYSTREASCTEHTCHTRKQMPSNEIVKIISQKIRSHHTGLGAAKLRQCILEQHKIDLELYSQNLGYTDMLSMLIEIPVIRFRNTSEKNIIIESNLFEDQDLPSAKVELCNAGPSSTSSLASSAKHSAQPDVSSKKKNGPHDPGSKTEFTRKVNHTKPISSHEDPTPILTIDGNAEKKNNHTQKYNNSQLEPPKKDLFFLNNVADFLRGFPSGLRIEKLKQHVLNTHHIDLESLSKELGYNDMPSMLKQVPGITSLNGDVFFSSAIPKSKEQLKQVKKVKFSEKRLVDYLKMFPCGLKVDTLRQHMKNQYKIDLMKYSQEKGSTDMVDMLQKVPGIKVLNKDLVIASDVYKKSNNKSEATIKTTSVKCPISATPGVTKSLQVKIKTPQVNLAVTKPSTSRPTGTSQQLSLPTHHIPFTNATINSPQNVHQGLRPNMSYASACASNLGTNQVNVQNLQCPPTFNVQKAHSAKIAQPNHREAPKDVIQSSNIKDKLQLLLKSHSNGLSIFQLKKIFLLKFQQPLACRGVSVRKILKNMEDVAYIKGVGVQMKVFPVLSEDNPSANICSDSTPQGAAVSSPLLIKNNTEHIKHSVPVLLSRQPPSSGYSHTDLTGGHVPKSSTGDISHKQTLCHTTEIFNNKWDTTTISHPANNLHPAGDAENIIDAQWPLLPQRLNILKEIKQRAKVSDQLPENIPNNDLCLKLNPTATSQPQGKDNSAQSLLKAHQDPSKTHCKMNDKQEPQTSELAHPKQQPGFSFVLEETGFSFLMGETTVDKDKNHMEMSLVGPPPNMFTDSTQVVFELSGKDAKRNTHATPVQPNQSAHCNMAAPEARRHSVNVLPQQLMSDFSSKNVPQQTDTHPVASELSTPNQKSNNSQSQQGQTHNNNNIFDPLILDPKRQQVTHTQTHFTSLQAQGIPPSSSSVQMVSMPSKGQQETSSSKSVCEFVQKRSTPLPAKQEVTKSNLNNKSGLTGSTKSQTPEKAPTSKTKIKAGNQHEPTEKNLTGVQTASNGSQAFSSVSQIQQVPTNPSVDTKGAPISDTLHKDVDFNAVNGMSILETQKKEHLQTRVVGTKTPPSSNQQKANTGCVYTREQTVTEPFQTQPKVPDPHTSSSMEQSRSSPRIHHYYNGTAGTAPEQEKRFTSKSHQHVSHWDHSVPPVLSAHPITPTNQQDSSDNSSEESTQTWQTDSDRSCCIL